MIVGDECILDGPNGPAHCTSLDPVCALDMQNDDHRDECHFCGVALSSVPKRTHNPKPQGGSNVSDIEINLDFSEETVPPSTFEPIPAGVYSLMCSSQEVKRTQAGEIMIVLQWTPEELPNKQIKDNWVVPGAQRREEDPDKWNTMMNMLRDRLEAVTGVEWRADQMALNPADLPGNTVIASVTIEPYDYENDKGERKTGMGNVIKRYYRPGSDTPPLGPNAEQPTFPSGNGGNTVPQAAPTGGGGFKL